MEEKETKAKKDGTIWFILLIGILVIFLGATIVYCLQLRTELLNTKSNPANDVKTLNETVEANNSDDKSEKKISEKEALKIGNEIFEKMNKILTDDDLYTKTSEGEEEIYYVLTDSQVKKIYSNMTKNAQKIFAKKTEVKKTNSYNLDAIQVEGIFATTDVGRKELKVSNIQEDELTFDVVIYNIKETDEQKETIDKTLKNSFMLKKEDNQWLIDYFE